MIILKHIKKSKRGVIILKKIAVKDFQANPFDLIGKKWMLVTAEHEGVVNTMTASWGGLGHMWNKDVAYVVLRPQRYTKELVDQEDTFTLSFYGEEHRKALGYLGTVSGRDEDKIAKSGLTATYVEGAPTFEEAELTIVCRKLFVQEYLEKSFISSDAEELVKTWYPEKDFHTLYIAEVLHIFEKE